MVPVLTSRIKARLQHFNVMLARQSIEGQLLLDVSSTQAQSLG
jgi:hypothetical protein